MSLQEALRRRQAVALNIFDVLSLEAGFCHPARRYRRGSAVYTGGIAMNIPSVLIANGAAVMLLLILLVSSRKTVHYGSVDNKLFVLMLLCAMLQCLTESAAFLMDGRAAFRTICVILDSILFFNNIIVFAFVWTLYADYKLFSSTERLKKRGRLLALPTFFVWVGCIVNLFTSVFFSVSAQNVYSRTGLFVLSYLLSYLYLVYGVCIIYFYRDKVHKYLFLPAVIFMIPILVGSILQYCFYGYSFIWLGSAIALVSLYINVQNEVSSVDALTGLFTGQYLLNYLTQRFRNLGADGTLCGIMLDIDHFKSINDTLPRAN